MSISQIVESGKTDYEFYKQVYKDLHQNPGISKAETYASGVAEKFLKKLGYKVTTKVGGYGLFGVYENGPGKTVLLRADMDALPVEEKTGLPYASKVRQKDPADGVEKPVMHACGHDTHITSMMATAETLINCREQWSGTVIILFQPDEENGAGARAMVEDGLYDPKKFACPIPDLCLGQHLVPYKAGGILTNFGTVMSAADSFKITIHGKGAHASQPSDAIDPLVIASHIVIRVQGIVPANVPALDSAVVTVSSLHAGAAHNVIGDKAVLQVNIRTRSEKDRTAVIEALKRIVYAECQASNSQMEPEFEQIAKFPLLVNNEDVTAKLSEAFDEHFGKDVHRNNEYTMMASEDFGVLADAINKPYCYWFFGGNHPALFEKTEKIPFNHSPYFAPVIEPTLQAGHQAMAVGALTFLKK